MKNTIYLLLVIIILVSGCEIKGDQKDNVVVETYIDSIKPIKTRLVVSVNFMLVCRTSAYGFLPEGSCLFNMSEAVRGYQVLVKNDGAVISTSYCTKEGLDVHLKLIKYKISVRDSIISIK